MTINNGHESQTVTKFNGAILLEESFALSSVVIERYLKSFQDIAVSEINPLLHFNIIVASFNFGVAFVIKPYTTPQKQEFTFKHSSCDLLNSSQRTVLDAFTVLGIDLMACLEEDECTNLQISIKVNQPYFLGTNVIYDKNAIYLIKESIPSAWEEEAATRDVKRIYQEIQGLPS